MRTVRPATAGFTYIEVLIAILLIGVLLIASASLARGIPLSRDARDQDLALRIADNELQALRAAGYAALPASGSFTDPDLASLASGTASVAVSAFNAKTKQVDVLVTWVSETGAPRSVTLTTLVTEVGGLP